MKKIKLAVLTALCLGAVNVNAQVDIVSSETIGNDKKYFIEKICIDGYVYINMYQKMPVMTINKYGSSSAYTSYPVMQGITQSFIDGKVGSKPEKCKSKTKKKVK